MTKLNLDELQALCDAATPGPWEANDSEVASEEFDIADTWTVRNALFIAAFNPDTAKALIARVRELEKENEELKKDARFEKESRARTNAWLAIQRGKS